MTGNTSNTLINLSDTYLGLVMRYLGTPQDLASLQRICKKLRGIFNSPNSLAQVQTFVASKNDPSEFALNKLHHLTSLDLSRCTRLTDNTFRYLQGLPLKALTFPASKGLTNEGLARVQILPLQSLTILGCRVISNSFLATLPPSLEQLHLFEATSISSEGLGHLKTLPLSCLSITRCVDITDETMEHLKVLKQLNVSGCQSIHILNPFPPGLQHLDLSYTRITIIEVEQFPTSLISLNLAGCQELGDDAMRFLKPMTSLTSLTLADCGLITNRGIAYLKQCPLEYLNLRNCRRVTIEGVIHFTNKPNFKLEVKGIFSEAGLS